MNNPKENGGEGFPVKRGELAPLRGVGRLASWRAASIESIFTLGVGRLRRWTTKTEFSVLKPDLTVRKRTAGCDSEHDEEVWSVIDISKSFIISDYKPKRFGQENAVSEHELSIAYNERTGGFCANLAPRLVSGPAIRHSPVAEVAGLHDYCGADPGDRNRCQYGGIQHHGRGSFSTACGAGSGPRGDG